MKLFVANLPFQTTEEQLREHFEQIGPVRKASLVFDKVTNRPRGFGFVEMETDDDAERAMNDLGGQELFGRQLRIEQSQERNTGGREQRYDGRR